MITKKGLLSCSFTSFVLISKNSIRSRIFKKCFSWCKNKNVVGFTPIRGDYSDFDGDIIVHKNPLTHPTRGPSLVSSRPKNLGVSNPNPSLQFHLELGREDTPHILIYPHEFSRSNTSSSLVNTNNIITPQSSPSVRITPSNVTKTLLFL